MAQGKKSFIIYTDSRGMVNKLSNERAGILFKTLFSYCDDENPICDDEVIDMAFEHFKNILKRDLIKYENIVERNRNNGKNGGRPKNPVGNLGSQEKQKEPKKADNDIDIDNDINNKPTSIKVDWSALINQFNLITGKKTKVISPIVKNKILARLKEGYSKQDFLNAIENCYNDKWHKETNHKHLTLEFISRADKLERFSTQK
jgi:uncharacterized phage protein (TIGR02220 family)